MFSLSLSLLYLTRIKRTLTRRAPKRKRVPINRALFREATAASGRKYEIKYLCMHKKSTFVNLPKIKWKQMNAKIAEQASAAVLHWTAARERFKSHMVISQFCKD
jgi:hypothetical protein